MRKTERPQPGIETARVADNAPSLAVSVVVRGPAEAMAAMATAVTRELPDTENCAPLAVTVGTVPYDSHSRVRTTEKEANKEKQRSRRSQTFASAAVMVPTTVLAGTGSGSRKKASANVRVGATLTNNHQ